VSLALLTDLYELTMAYGYWRAGKARGKTRSPAGKPVRPW